MEDMWIFIKKYLKSNKEFELRFALVVLLDYYITDEYIDRVLQILNTIKNNKYYVKMALAWAIQVCFVKQEEKTMQFLKNNNNLDDFTFNKALQKIIESYRVDEKTKEIMKKMKRK